MRAAIERHKSRRVARAARHDEPEEADPWADMDKSKWQVSECLFDSTYTGDTLGKEKEFRGQPIDYGIKKFKKNPKKYVAMLYQTNLLKRPTERHVYTYVYRKGTVGFKASGIHKDGWMTLMTNDYQQLPPFPDNELPSEFRDEYTDDMLWNGRKIHSKENVPLLPGRGMGVCDVPHLKIIGDVDPSDIAQGHVGDCWMLSGISALAEFDGAIKRCFRKTLNLDQLPMDTPQMITVTLWDLASWTEHDIVIDERLCANPGPGGQLLGAKPSEDGELWVSYLEKALAIHCGGWDKIVGGQCTHAWTLLTGCKYQYTIRKNPKTGLFACYGKYNTREKRWVDHANSPHDGDKRRWKIPWPEVGGGGTKELTQEELFMRMCAWDDSNFIVAAGCSDGKGDAGLVDNHAYSVIECLNDVAGTPIDMMKVRNPWGKGEIEDGEFDDDGPGWDKYPQIKAELNPVVADDGIFWVTKQEFFEFFGTIFLSASDMTEFLED